MSVRIFTSEGGALVYPTGTQVLTQGSFWHVYDSEGQVVGGAYPSQGWSWEVTSESEEIDTEPEAQPETKLKYRVGQTVLVEWGGWGPYKGRAEIIYAEEGERRPYQVLAVSGAKFWVAAEAIKGTPYDNIAKTFYKEGEVVAIQGVSTTIDRVDPDCPERLFYRVVQDVDGETWFSAAEIGYKTGPWDEE